MAPIRLTVARVLLFGATIPYWLWLTQSRLSPAAVVACVLLGVAACYPIVWLGRLAADWMYAWTRNPMMLTTLAFFVALGLWFQSALFVAWILLWVTPWFIYFLKVFEERELEIRLGKVYMDYRKQVPFMWPRKPVKKKRAA